MLFLADDDAGPDDPLTADLTPVFQAIGFGSALVLLAVVAVLIVRFVRLRRQDSFPRPLTIVAVVLGVIAVIGLGMAIRAGVVA